MWLLLQVADKYVHLVTSINNADTLITLIVPSIMIIFSNFRISVALSQYYHDRQVMLAQNRQTERTSGDAAVAAAAIRESSSSTSPGRRLGQQNSLITVPTTSADHTQRRSSPLADNCSFDRLQMKVTLITHNCCK